MSYYRNRQDIANKADYEGGVLELVFGYGLFVEELPEDDIELREALEDLLKMRPVIERFNALLPEPGYDDEA